MGKNFVKEVFDFDATWTCPPGVKVVHASLYAFQPIVSCGDAFQAFNLFGGNGGTSLGAVGTNTNGELGDNTIVNKSTPVFMTGRVSPPFFQRQIATGGAFNIISSDIDSFVLCTGLNTSGQLGDGSIAPRSIPGFTTNLNISTTIRAYFKKINGGSAFAAALGTNKTIYTWGANASGQLGSGSTTSRSSPVAISGTWKNLGTGNDHMLALDGTGTPFAWGLNTNGQLGDNSVVSKSTPTAVSAGGRKFVQVAGGSDFSYGLTSDGDIYAWGNNSVGQLGDGTVIPKSTPTAVSAGGRKFQKITNTRGQFGFAIDRQGAGYTWGLNSSGQLGDGTTTNRSTPVAVTGGLSFVDISAGAAFCSGYSMLGLYSWGLNSSGQLGINSTTPVSSPNAIAPGGNASSTFLPGSPTPPRRLYARQVIDVTPGTSYPITIFGIVAGFGPFALGPGWGSDQTIELEYFA